MGNHVTVAQLIAMRQKWEQSEVHANLCAQERNKYTHLFTKGYQLFQNADRIISEAKANAVDTVTTRRTDAISKTDSLFIFT